MHRSRSDKTKRQEEQTTKNNKNNNNMTKLTVHVRNIQASEEKPFELFIVDNSTQLCSETENIASKTYSADIPAPTTQKSHVVSIRITIRARGVNSTQKFDLVRDGSHILLADEGGLKIVQRHDANFGEKQTTITTTGATNPSNSPRDMSSPRGFIVDPITGQKKYVTKNAPASPRVGTTTATTATTATTTSVATAQQGAVEKKQYTMDDLERLAEMKQKGTLTEQEFAEIKKQVLEL